MKRTPLLALALGLLALTGCSGSSLAAAQQAVASGQQLQAQVQATQAAATAQLAAATQPAQRDALAATTQALAKTQEVMQKALDVSNGLLQAAQAKSATDPNFVAGLEAVNAAVPNPYTPLIALGIPLLATIGGIVVQSLNHGKAIAAVVDSNGQLAGAVTDAHQTLLNASQTIATLSQPPPPPIVLAAAPTK